MRYTGMIWPGLYLACQSGRPAGSTSDTEASLEVGTPHPVALIHPAITGRWIAVCQARRDTDGKPGIED